MKTTVFVSLLFMSIITQGIAQSDKTEIFVSPQGSDTYSGTEAKPFRTLEQARDAARSINREKKVIISLRGGIYARDKVFELTTEDSGNERNPIVYRGYPGEDVRIIGGKAVSDWEKVSDKAVLELLPSEARDQVVRADLKSLDINNYGQVKDDGLGLFFQEKPMTLARGPNEGFMKITGLVEPGTRNVHGIEGSKTGKFMYEGERPERWIGEKDAWVHGYWFWDWSDQRHAIKSLDTAKQIISVEPPYHNYGYRVGQWFYGFNILAELDRPGEYYVDREEGMLYFWPPASIDSGDAVVSLIPGLIETNDVSHVRVRGVTLEACRETAVVIHGGTQNHIIDCIIRNVGDYAVQISDATESGVYGSEIYGTGEGGVSLNGGSRKTLTPANLYVYNTHIHHYARWNRMYTPAVSLSGVGNLIAHNHFHHAPHMAIGFSGNNHIIEFNEIHDVCLESNDAGAIYAGRDWTMRGTVIRHNYLHDINGFKSEGAVGVYLDDMFCGTRISGNVFYNVTRAAFIGGGRDNVVENNIFVNCRNAMHMDARALGWASYHVNTTMKERLNAMPYQSEIWRKHYPGLVDILEDEPAAPKGNIVRQNIFVGKNWNDINEKARQYLLFKDNLVNKDPHFVGKPPENFQLDDDSPAYELGFEPIPLESIGIEADKYPEYLQSK
ncbi:MAG: right-handed parallel beta-helix repeat-containing protein [Bacteroidales bacterium]